MSEGHTQLSWSKTRSLQVPPTANQGLCQCEGNLRGSPISHILTLDKSTGKSWLKAFQNMAILDRKLFIACKDVRLCHVLMRTERNSPLFPSCCRDGLSQGSRLLEEHHTSCSAVAGFLAIRSSDSEDLSNTRVSATTMSDQRQLSPSLTI